MQAGIPRNPDFNGAQQELRTTRPTSNQRRRWSTAKAYLQPALQRRTWWCAPAPRHALIENTVPPASMPPSEGRHAGHGRGHHPVVPAGSPQPLLSGLGPAQHLQDIGIDVVRDIPAVGLACTTKLNSYVSWRCRRSHAERPGAQSGPPNWRPACAMRCSAPARWRATASTRTVHPQRSSARRPDVQINVFECGTLTRNKDGVIAAPVPRLYAQSGASATRRSRHRRLASPDPLAPPAVLFFLRTDYDMQAVIFGIRLARRIMISQP